MVIDQLLEEGVKSLKGIEHINPQLEVRLILSRLMDVDKSYLYAYGDREVSKEITSEFREWIGRRKEGYPLQYLLGSQEFMGIDLEVCEGVLIPRGDTEILVEYLIDHIEKTFGKMTFNLLDIGIGTGSISLAIAKRFPNGNIYGVDLYDRPLALAKRNRDRLGLENVTYVKSDIFSYFAGDQWKGFFHVIVSNPPYIPEGERESLQIEVRDHEPSEALFAGEDGLWFYERITRESVGYLVKEGLLAYETGHDQGEDVAKIMRSAGYGDITLLDDLENRNRVVAGRS